MAQSTATDGEPGCSFEREFVSHAPETEAAWWAKALSSHIRDMQEMVLDFIPWLSPEFAALEASPTVLVRPSGGLSLTPELRSWLCPDRSSGASHNPLEKRRCQQEIAAHDRSLATSFYEALARSVEASRQMLAPPRSGLAISGGSSGRRSGFSLSIAPKRTSFRSGMTLTDDRLWDCHYDLLASEARAAMLRRDR